MTKMATEQTVARTIYKEARESLPDLSDRVYARIIGCGSLKLEANIRKKLADPHMPSARAVSQAEVLAPQLLVLLDREGFDLSAMEFDEDGRLIKAPKKAGKSR
jgi:hypothetical protein